MPGPLGGETSRLGATPASVTVTGLQPGGVIVLDFTGDGQDDLILGSDTNLYVVPGPLSDGQSFDVASRSVLILTGLTEPSEKVLAAGRVAADPQRDLIVAEPSLFGLSEVFVVPSGLNISGTVSIGDTAATYVKSRSIRKLGVDVSAGDLDADGRSDLILGTLAEDVSTHPPGYEDAGKVFVLYSGTDVEPEFSATPTPTPGNNATATARALSTATPTPTPGNSATATAQALTPTVTPGIARFFLLVIARAQSAGW